MIEIDGHDVAERARLLMDRLIARRIRSDPATIDRAIAHLVDLRAADGAADRWWIDAWLEILRTRSSAAVATLVVSRDERMSQLRSASPFVVEVTGLDFSDREFRRRLWRKARAGIERFQDRHRHRWGNPHVE